MNASVLTRWLATFIGLLGAGTLAYNTSTPAGVRLAAVLAAGVVAAAHTLAAHYHLASTAKATATVAAAKAVAPAPAVPPVADVVAAVTSSLLGPAPPVQANAGAATVLPHA